MNVTVYGPGGYNPDLPNNNIVEQYETPDPPPRPLDATGALATLLAVTETVTVADAANAVGLTADDLIHEAEAWAAASGGAP
jgi:hypothetical protein